MTPILTYPFTAAIDPGVKHCAMARGERGTLVQVGLVESYQKYAPEGLTSAVGEVIWECPQADGRSMTTDDAIALAAAGAQCAAWISPRVFRVTVREWKGGVPKPIHHARLWAVLTDAEREILGGEKTLDAIDGACERGARDRWAKDGKLYYRARELPTVNGVKITHDLLDAAALLMFGLGRLPGP